MDMLYQYLILLCLGVAAHGKIVYDRYATFYNTWNCDEDLAPKDYDHTVAMSMTKGECIRETGRQSFMPGKKDTKTGNICFVWYEDGDGNCERIQGARMMHFIKDPALVNCEAANVTGHNSYHFEWARPNDRNGEKNLCPSSGSYVKDENGVDSVVRSEMALDGRVGTNPELFDENGCPDWPVG